MRDIESVRIGMVNFINTAALYEVWKKRPHPLSWHVIEAAPAELNGMLACGDLDLGIVSSYEYADHPERYQILPNLSISASGAVGSVFLFSRLPPGTLDGKMVCLSEQSKTSNGLIKIILEDFFNVRPLYGRRVRGVSVGDFDAVLAIGDQALRLNLEGGFPYVLDLGEIWQWHTGLPFVFAVWAVSEEFAACHPECLSAIHQELLRCVSLGKSRLADISRSVAGKIPMDEHDCLSYLQGIELNCGPEELRGLELFYTYLIRRNEADPHALPVKIWNAGQYDGAAK